MHAEVVKFWLNFFLSHFQFKLQIDFWRWNKRAEMLEHVCEEREIVSTFSRHTSVMSYFSYLAFKNE